MCLLVNLKHNTFPMFSNQWIKTVGLPREQWKTVLPEALHSVRSLLCTDTNTTPHERFFSFQRRSSVGQSLPRWLTCPGAKAFLHQFVWTNKTDFLVDEVEVLSVNLNYAHVRHPNGREVTVSLQDLVPYPSEANHSNEQDLPERSSDDTENDVYDQVPTEESRNNTEGKTRLLQLTLSYLESQYGKIKAFYPFDMVFMTRMLNLSDTFRLTFLFRYLALI